MTPKRQVTDETEVRFFATAADFRAWMAAHHDKLPAQWVGFHKRDSGRPSITWPESVDVALCFGWIDGVRKSIDATSYKIRFTPRKKNSKWSSVNTKRVAELSTLGLMHAAGLTAFAGRKSDRSGIYAYEQRHLIELDPSQEKQFRRSKQGWKFFQAQPAWYRKTALWWVVSAKREETREKRLAELIEYSAQEKTIRQLTRPPAAKRSSESQR
jgi:uncharacterized protein YdeI (YjbR/CyaY-like superfamily)